MSHPLKDLLQNKDLFESLADEFGTTIDHAYEDEFMKPQAKKKKLKNKKKKRA